MDQFQDLTKLIEDKINRSTWKPWKFSDLANNIVEKVVPKDSGLEHYIGLEQLDSGSLHIKRFGETGSLVGDKLKIYKGDLIFAKRNAYLKRVAIAKFDAVASAHSMVLRANPKNVLPEFLPFFMLSETFWDKAIEISVGSLSPTINWKALAKQEFLLPPIDQQVQLSKLLWASDEIIEAASLNLELTRRLLVSFRENSLCDRKFPRLKLGKGLKQIIAGKSLGGVNRSAQNDQKGVLKVSAVGEHGFVSSENKVLDDQSGFLEKYKVHKYDVLITRANTTELVGRVCMVEDDYPNLMLSDKTLKLDLNNKVVSNSFAVEVLRSCEVRQQIESYATGTGGAMKNISQSEIKSLEVPFPDIKVQNDLVKRLNLILNNKALVESYKIKAQSLQKSLINQIF